MELGWVSAVDRQGRRIWIVDAHREGKRFGFEPAGSPEIMEQL
jgi:hypothetical protein